jgi:hypothetical protein
MNFCGDCGNKLTNGACATCTAKSASGINIESLEKSLETLESISKGVRPAEAKQGEKEEQDPEQKQAAQVKQTKKYGAKGEGDSEEEPKTKRGIESAAKGGFPGPGPEMDGDGDFDGDEEDPRERRRREMEMEGEPEFKSAKGKKAKKSLADDLLESEEIAKAVDVSDFLEELVYKTAEAQDSLSAEVSKSIRFNSYQREFNVGLAKAMSEFGTLIKSLVDKVEEIGKQPAGIRKSDLTVVEKGAAEPNADNKSNTLSKSQVAEKLLALQQAGDKSIEANDILRVEIDGFLKPEHKTKLGIA